MENSIATASVDVVRIKRRQYMHLLFRGLRKFAPGGDGENVDSLLLYPPFESATALGDVCNRLGWYFPIDDEETCRIHLALGDGLELDDRTVPDAQATFPVDGLPITTHDADAVGEVVPAVDRILVRDAFRRFDRRLLPVLGNVELVDPEYYSEVEPNTWPHVSDRVLPDGRGQSERNYRRLERRVADADRAFVFATGPSLDRAMEFDFPDDAVSVVCNSIVRNDDILSTVQPDVLVFADPVFHFGPSRYADEFRQDVAKTVRGYDCTVAIPRSNYGLLVNHYPEFRDAVVGIRVTGSEEPIYPTADRLEVMATDNIMTLYMLPIASALADEVYIVGADGREEDESYFWEHSETAQYDDELMRMAVDTHPSFFRDRVYEDYYQQHLETLEEMLMYGEQRGVSYYSVTDSYIPCLDERKIDAAAAGLA